VSAKSRVANWNRKPMSRNTGDFVLTTGASPTIPTEEGVDSSDAKRRVLLVTVHIRFRIILPARAAGGEWAGSARFQLRTAAGGPG
jgi:hypothetical protein